MPDSKVMEEYIGRVLEHLGDEDLSKVEETLGSKLRETRARAEDLRSDIDRLKKTIQQANERLNNLGMEYSASSNKAAGIAESLIALKFGSQIKEEKEKREEADFENGSRATPPPTRKKKPTRAAAGKTRRTKK